MRPFETADVAFLETLKARQETLKTELTAAERAQDAQHTAKIAVDVRRMSWTPLRAFCRTPSRSFAVQNTEPTEPLSSPESPPL